jgi:hypothetical protein
MREAERKRRLHGLPTPHSDRRAVARGVVHLALDCMAATTPAAAVQRLG